MGRFLFTYTSLCWFRCKWWERWWCQMYEQEVITQTAWLPDQMTSLAAAILTCFMTSDFLTPVTKLQQQQFRHQHMRIRWKDQRYCCFHRGIPKSHRTNKLFVTWHIFEACPLKPACYTCLIWITSECVRQQISWLTDEPIILNIEQAAQVEFARIWGKDICNGVGGTVRGCIIKTVIILQNILYRHKKTLFIFPGANGNKSQHHCSQRRKKQSRAELQI